MIPAPGHEVVCVIYACVHRLDLDLYFQPKELQRVASEPSVLTTREVFDLKYFCLFIFF